ncbi:MAG: hypothetical protein MJK04_27970, partial [Psychrosphaera sp.]|nr:hypothetical protein [Psychrosphaera sp.]
MEISKFNKSLLAASVMVLFYGCSPVDKSAIDEQPDNTTTATSTYSSFGSYQELADWSDWCPA